MNKKVNNNNDEKLVAVKVDEGEMRSDYDDVEWVVAQPVQNNPLDNLLSAFRGFCVPETPPLHHRQPQPHIRYRTHSNCKASISSNNSHGAVPLVLVDTDDGDSSTSHSIQTCPSADEIVHPSSANSNPQTITFRLPDIVPSSSDILEPIFNLKKAIFNGAGFCDPFVQLVANKEDIKYKYLRKESNGTSVVDEGEFADCRELETDSEEWEDEEADELLVEVQPGTNRKLRVYQALEMFCSAIAMLIVTIQIIQRMELRQPTIRLITRDPQDDRWPIRLS